MSAYIIVFIEKTNDLEQLKAYRKLGFKTMAGHTAKPLAIYGRQRVVEGPDFESVAMIEFPTFEEAEAWYDSPGYQEAVQHRLKGATCRAVIVEGL